MPNIMTEPLEIRRKRLIYRCDHRGTKELDLILGSFARINAPLLSEQELGMLEALIEERENDLMDWIVGRASPPARHDNALMARLRQFRFVDSLR